MRVAPLAGEWIKPLSHASILNKQQESKKQTLPSLDVKTLSCVGSFCFYILSIIYRKGTIPTATSRFIIL